MLEREIAVGLGSNREGDTGYGEQKQQHKKTFFGPFQS